MLKAKPSLLRDIGGGGSEASGASLMTPMFPLAWSPGKSSVPFSERPHIAVQSTPKASTFGLGHVPKLTLLGPVCVQPKDPTLENTARLCPHERTLNLGLSLRQGLALIAQVTFKFAWMPGTLGGHQVK